MKNGLKIALAFVVGLAIGIAWLMISTQTSYDLGYTQGYNQTRDSCFNVLDQSLLNQTLSYIDNCVNYKCKASGLNCSSDIDKSDPSSWLAVEYQCEAQILGIDQSFDEWANSAPHNIMILSQDGKA